MSLMSVLKGHSDDIIAQLKSIFLTALNAWSDELGHGPFKCFTEKAMVGQLIRGFVKDSCSHRVKKIQTTRVKSGFKGKTGNKGGVIIRFLLDDTSMIFANCHLESGSSKAALRL